MDITFHGAAHTVTGSQHLIQVNGHKLLLDCGLFQGARSETYYRNQHFMHEPSEVDTLFLSHAHTDHAGNIPNLVKKGFHGPIKTTAATRDLAGWMIRDSARIQESDAAFVNKKRAIRGEPPIEPLYGSQDAEAALKLFSEIPYGQAVEIIPGVTAEVYDAGHILGAVVSVFNIEEAKTGRKIRLGFSGDLGRKNMSILRDPEYLHDIDYLIMESTYGDRLHRPIEEAALKLRALMREAIDRRGKVIIPAFAVGRSQELIYSLHQLMESGDIAHIPIYVDSPLAVNVSKVFSNHKELYDTEAGKLLEADDDGNLFTFPEVHYIQSVDESKALNDTQEPMVIISASGMCETGRILHHLKNNIEKPNTTVLIVSWQAPNTLGRRLVDQEKKVSIFGQSYNVRARVEAINGYSGHADQAGLTEWALAQKGRLKKVFLVHGEQGPADALAARLREGGISDVYYPDLHETVSL
jgi:metallo-beta-lactamase family protein